MKFFPQKIALLAISLFFTMQTGGVTSAIEDQQIQSVAQIIIMNNDLSESYSTGSAVLLYEGENQIISNYHVVEEAILNPDELTIVICITFDAKEEPGCGFQGKVLKYNKTLDLALIEVVGVYDDEEKKFIPLEEYLREHSNEDISEVRLGVRINAEFSQNLTLGDEITALGYPAYGGTTITLTEGKVSGFDTITVQEENYVFYIKTDAKINPGNSGGAAFDENNNFVGIPTAVAGGDGNIGYLIPVETVSLFLRGKDAAVTAAVDAELEPYQCGENSQYYDGGIGCRCDEGYEWANEEKENFDCVPKKCGEHSTYLDGGEQCTCDEGYEWVDPDDEENIDCISSEELAMTPLFSDVPVKHKNRTAIEYLKEQGIIQGYPDGEFKPRKPVNRAELLKILIESNPEIQLSEKHKVSCFIDVPTDAWFTPYVCYAKEQNWVKGYENGTFKPDQTVSKVEALKIILTSFGFEIPATAEVSVFTDMSLGDWFASYIEVAHKNQLLEDVSGELHPHEGMSRASVSESIYRTILLLEKQKAEKMERYTNKKAGFSLDLPAGWYKEEPGIDNPLRAGEDRDDEEGAVIGVSAQTAKAEQLKDFIEYIRKGFLEDEGTTFISQEEFIIDGEKGEKMVFHLVDQNAEGEEVEVYFVGYFVFHNETIYAIFAGSKAEEQEKYAELFDTIMASFKFE